MNKHSPLVSVIMPVYNCEPFLHESMQSILDQTYKNLELIVVDDHSKDKSWDIIQEFASRDARIRPFRNEQNLKIVATLNFAISQSKGKYFVRMDGDDRRELDSIEAQVDFLEKNPDCVIVGGAINVCDKDMNFINKRLYPKTDAEIRSKIFRYNPFAHPAIVLRAVALEADPYKLNWAEDYDLYFRLAEVGKLANLEKVVVNLRTHRQSVSQSKLAYQEKLTLYIRLKAVFEYGFIMSRADKIYFAAQLISSLMMPLSFRFWLFNKLRSRS